MRRFSTAVAVLSVALGVAALAAVIAVDSWQRQEIQRLTAEFAPDVLVLRYADQWPDDVVAEPGESFGISFEEAMSLSGVDGVLAVGYHGSGGRVLGGQLSLQRVAVSATIFEVLGFDFAAGAGFTDTARQLDLPVVVLGASAAEELFGGAQAAVGQTVDLGMGVARVEGVLAPVPGDVAEFQYFNIAALVPAGGSFDFFTTRRPAATRVFVRHEEGAAERTAAGLRVALKELPTGRGYEVVGPETWLGSQRVFRNRVADELTEGIK